MSHLATVVPGRGRLRWSVVGGGQSAPPLSSAGLPATSACVNVGPPLFASGAIPGSVLMMSPVPWQRLLVQVVPVGQSVGRVHGPGSQLVPTSMLCPPDVKPVPKFWHASLGGSCAKMVYLNVTSPRLKKAPPCGSEMLLLMVTLTSVAVPLS